MPEQQQLNIAFPPDFVFKFPRNRVNPSQEVIQDQGVFDFVGVKYPAIYHEAEEFFERTKMKREWFKYPVMFMGNQIIVRTDYSPLTEYEEKMGGQLSCFQDVPYPFKGHPFPQSMYFIGLSKRFSRELIEFLANKDFAILGIVFSLLPWKLKEKIIDRFLLYFSNTARKPLEPYLLGRKFMSKYGQEIAKFIENFLQELNLGNAVAQESLGDTIRERFAELVATHIDSDNAYWMRLGDVMSTSSKKSFLENPRQELKRLARLLADRNPQEPGIRVRLGKAINGISLLLLIPKIKRAFRKAMAKSDFERFQFDEADKYHCLPYVDYNYLGLDPETRMEMYKKFHEEHPPFPARFKISPPT